MVERKFSTCIPESITWRQRRSSLDYSSKFSLTECKFSPIWKWQKQERQDIWYIMFLVKHFTCGLSGTKLNRWPDGIKCGNVYLQRDSREGLGLIYWLIYFSEDHEYQARLISGPADRMIWFTELLRWSSIKANGSIWIPFFLLFSATAMLTDRSVELLFSTEFHFYCCRDLMRTVIVSNEHVLNFA